MEKKESNSMKSDQYENKRSSILTEEWLRKGLNSEIWWRNNMAKSDLVYFPGLLHIESESQDECRIADNLWSNGKVCQEM